MIIHQVTQNVSVAPQILPSDVDALAEMGFRSVICNRPDDEEPGQSDFASIATAAGQLGLQVRHIPVVGPMFSQEAVSQTAEAFDEMPGPVLAYCRSGTRSITLWALSQAGKRSPSDILQHAQNAGYDLGGLAAFLPEVEG